MLRATADRYRRDNSAVPYLCSADTSRLTMYSDVEYETVLLLLLPTLSLRRLNRRVATTSTIFEPKWFPKEKEKRRKRKRKEIVSPHFTNKLSLACRYYYCCCCCCTFFSPCLPRFCYQAGGLQNERDGIGNENAWPRNFAAAYS